MSDVMNVVAAILAVMLFLSMIGTVVYVAYFLALMLAITMFGFIIYQVIKAFREDR